MNDTIKEFIRGLILAVFPVIIVQLSDPALTIRAIVISVVIAVLRGVDEYLSEKKLGINENGISGL